MIRKRIFKKRFFSFVTGIFLLILIAGFFIKFQNVGGEAILKSVEDFLSERNLFLKAEHVTGNPFKGYFIKNVSVYDSGKNIVLSLENVNCNLSFKDLLKGKLKLSDISLHNLKIDFEKCITEIKNSERINNNSLIRNLNEDFAFEKISLFDSEFKFECGIFAAEEIFIDTALLDISFKGNLNNIEINGFADFNKTYGALEINRADINFGSGKILATGGILNLNNSDGIFDLHSSVHEINLQQLTSLWENTIKKENYDGTVSLNIDVYGSTRHPKVKGTGNYKGTKISGFPVESFSANFNYANNVLNMDNIQAYALNVPINGKIIMTTSSKSHPIFTINLEGSEATLEELDTILKNSELKKLKGTINSINANLKGNSETMDGIINFYSRRIFYDGNIIKNLKAQMKFAKSSSAIINGKFDFEGSQGYIQGNVSSVFFNPEYNLIVKIVNLEFEKLRGFIRDYDDYKILGKVSALFNIKGKIFNPEIFGEFSDSTVQKNLPFRVSENKITFFNSKNISGGI